MTLLIRVYLALAWRIPGWLQTPGWYRPLTRNLGHFIREHQAIGLGLVIFAEELGIPLPAPGDVAIAWGGYLTTIGEIPVWAAYAAVITGATTGSTCLFLLSRRFGHPFVMRLGRYVGLSEERFLHVEAAFRRYGPWAIIFGRHIPGMRIYLSALAGLFEVRTIVFVPCVAISSTIWAVIFIELGRFLGRRSGLLFRLVPAHLLPYAILILALGIVIFVGWHHGWRPFRERRRAGRGQAPQVDAAKPHVELHKT